MLSSPRIASSSTRSERLALVFRLIVPALVAARIPFALCLPEKTLQLDQHDGVGQPLLKRVATHVGIMADRRLTCRRVRRTVVTAACCRSDGWDRQPDLLPAVMFTLRDNIARSGFTSTALHHSGLLHALTACPFGSDVHAPDSGILARRTVVAQRTTKKPRGLASHSSGVRSRRFFRRQTEFAGRAAATQALEICV